jgi:hypothetical protein
MKHALEGSLLLGLFDIHARAGGRQILNVFHHEGVSSNHRVKGNFVVEPVQSLVLPLVPVSSHRTEDEVAVDEVVTAVLSFTFLAILSSWRHHLRLKMNLTDDCEAFGR